MASTSARQMRCSTSGRSAIDAGTADRTTSPSRYSMITNGAPTIESSAQK